jgi:hypothetical protein
MLVALVMSTGLQVKCTGFSDSLEWKQPNLESNGPPEVCMIFEMHWIIFSSRREKSDRPSSRPKLGNDGIGWLWSGEDDVQDQGIE